jgi:hypothetical protein
MEYIRALRIKVYLILNPTKISQIEELFFVVDAVVELVEVADEVLLFEGEFGFGVGAVLLLQFLVEFLPTLVEVLAVLLVLLHCVDLLLLGVHAERLLESERVDLLQNGLESDQRLL